MKVNKFIFSFFIFIFGFSGSPTDTASESISVSSSDDMEQVARRPPVIGYWESPPSVRICQGAPVTLTRVNQAVEFWRRLGYEFGPVVRDNSPDCSFTRIHGSIMIGLVDQNFIEPNLAMTRTLTSNRTRQIVMSKILIKADSATKQRVLEHEFGHALGWRHFNRRYHIMNSEWDRGGWTTTGLRRSEQIEILEDTVPEAFEDLSDEEYLDSF